MAASFEFLANFEAWRQECRQKLAAMDRCPFPEDRGSIEQRTAHAELLNTLTAFEETRDKAKNGEQKNGNVLVGGFPGLINGKKCELPGEWKDWLLPAPSDLCRLPDGSCLVKLEVTLQSPFFSRDDRPFYPTDNVLKRHHVFLTPHLAASGLKGLLRWAWSMSGGSEEDAALLFGEAADAPGEDSRQGLLRVWPVYWKGRVGLEVINPQDRISGAGTTPVKYEVVQPGSSGNLCLLLVNEGNAAPRLFRPLMDAIWHLVDHGGLSAKNSAGWGQVQCNGGFLAIRGMKKRTVPEKQIASPADDKAARWAGLLDAEGELLPFDPALFTKKRLEQLGITAMKLKKTYNNDARAAYEAIREKGEWRTDCAAQPAAAPNAEEPIPAEWLVTPPLRTTFVTECNAYAQELATWLK